MQGRQRGRRKCLSPMLRNVVAELVLPPSTITITPIRPNQTKSKDNKHSRIATSPSKELVAGVIGRYGHQNSVGNVSALSSFSTSEQPEPQTLSLSVSATTHAPSATQSSASKRSATIKQRITAMHTGEPKLDRQQRTTKYAASIEDGGKTKDKTALTERGHSPEHSRASPSSVSSASLSAFSTSTQKISHSTQCAASSSISYGRNHESFSTTGNDDEKNEGTTGSTKRINLKSKVLSSYLFLRKEQQETRLTAVTVVPKAA